VYLITAPKRGNTAGINDAIVAEITLNTLYICLFTVEIVVEVMANNFSRIKDIELVVLETADRILESTLCNDTVAADVEIELRVFPNNFTIVATELDNATKILGMDLKIVATELETAVMVDVIAFLIVGVDVT
jgi:hypothetical protein